MNEKGEFFGKVGLVTGASKGIGRGIAIELARYGADVLVNYFTDEKGAIETQRGIFSLGRKAVIFKADVSKSKDVKRMFDVLTNEFGRLDFLINNSAIAIWKPFEKITEEDWDKTIDTNLKSVFLCVKNALPLMKNNGGGVIVNISSVGSHAYIDCLVPYCASKGGVNLITKSLAAELAKYDIRVNAVAPGTIAIKRNYDTDPDYPNNWFPYIPQKRVGEVKEVVEPVIFMCSNKSSHITGQVLFVDGGISTYLPMPGSNFARRD